MKKITIEKSFYHLLFFLFFLITISIIGSERVDASNHPRDGVYMIQPASNSNFVINIKNCSRENCANISLYKRVGSVNQLFAIQYIKTEDGTNYYRIMNPFSLKVLDVANGSKDNGANCIQYDWQGTDNQLWSIEIGLNSYRIKSKLGTYLDNSDGNMSNGNNIQLWERADNDNQKWMLIPMGNIELASLIYREVSECGTREDGNNNVKYNEWFYDGDSSKYGPWCAAFQSWCVYKATGSTLYKSATASGMAKKYNLSLKYFKSKAFGGSYTPQVGDLLFTNPGGSSGDINAINHVAFVLNIDENGNIFTVDGNSHSKDDPNPNYRVWTTTRHVDDRDISGYAVLDCTNISPYIEQG